MDYEVLGEDLKFMFEIVKPYKLEVEVLLETFEQLMGKFPQMELDDIQECLSIGIVEWLK